MRGVGGKRRKRRKKEKSVKQSSSHRNTGSRRDHSRPGLRESGSVRVHVRSRPERDFPEPTASGERAHVSGRRVRTACGPLPCVLEWISVCDASALNDRAHVCAAACVVSVGPPPVLPGDCFLVC